MLKFSNNNLRFRTYMYQEEKFELSNLRGLSERQIAEHIKLYSGYVKNTNDLVGRIDKIKSDPLSDNYTLAELRRRLGFEFNGMRLHEYYFQSMNGYGNIFDGKLKGIIENQFGSFDNWIKEFKTAGLARGIGWVLLCHDPKINKLFNVWITDHEVGHLASVPIILAMDVWEHAYLLDYLPSQRKEYIEAFFSNLNWKTLEERINRI